MAFTGSTDNTQYKETKALWKTIWNVHILDKLYWVHKSELKIEDTPITSIVVDGRDIKINDLDKITDTAFGNKQTKINYYLNKIDADNELLKLKN